MGNAIKYIKKEISNIPSQCKEEEVIVTLVFLINKKVINFVKHIVVNMLLIFSLFLFCLGKGQTAQVYRMLH